MDICIDKSLPVDLSKPQELTLLTSRKWPNGKILKYSFLGGELAIHNNIAIKLVKLEQYCNIKFVYEPIFENGDIRISFQAGNGSWSYIGTDCLYIPKDKPTMNLAGLTKDMPLNLYKVVHHEFLHALGFKHEHQHPEANIQWNKEYVYWYYGTYFQWSKEKVDTQIFQVYDKTLTQYSKFDPLSIMIYSIPKEFTLNGFSVPWNQYLSETDKAFLAQIYPKDTPTQVLPPYSVYFDTITEVTEGKHPLIFSNLNTDIPLPKGKYRLTIRALQ